MISYLYSVLYVYMIQRHSVLSRMLRGLFRRNEVHSLSGFEHECRSAHSDLLRFTEVQRSFDFDTFFSSMSNELEHNIKECYEIELHITVDGKVNIRSKPRMSDHVPWSATDQYWPVAREAWTRLRGGVVVEPTLPAFDAVPGLAELKTWDNYAAMVAGLREFYSDSTCCPDRAERYEMLTLLRQWGDDPRLANWTRPQWPTWDTDLVVDPADLPRVGRPVPRPRPRRPPPLVQAPIARIGSMLPSLQRRRRGRGRGRGGRRGRGRGRRGRGRRGRGRGRGRGRTRLTRVEVSSSSSEEEVDLGVNEVRRVRTRPRLGDEFVDSDDPDETLRVIRVGRIYAYTRPVAHVDDDTYVEGQWTFTDALTRINR